MQRKTYHRSITNLFTEAQNRLVYEQNTLSSFIDLPFSKINFIEQIKSKKDNYSKEVRGLLSKHMSDRYKDLECSEKTKSNIVALADENTFTITTGHQLSLLSGPIFLIYKILHIIKLTEELNSEFPEFHFVPVYWMASEDHDFEEVKKVQIFNQVIDWDTNQIGPVGRFKTDGLDQIVNNVLSFFQNHPGCDAEKVLQVYHGKTYSEATFNLIHALFDKFGLIILDGDHPELKKLFKPIMERELLTQFSYNAITQTNKKIESEGLKIQATAREINLFYIENQLRERILKTENGFFIEGKGTFNKNEMIEILESHPEFFSPNVILRPVYQEFLLPNLCYVGGASEIMYWLQLKDIFNSISLSYPMIQVRNSLLWIDSVTSLKMDKIPLVLEDLFRDRNDVKSDILKSLASDELDFSVLDSNLHQLKYELEKKIIETDTGLDKFAQAELAKLSNQIKFVKEKLIKATKKQNDQVLSVVDQIFDRLLSNGLLQERFINLFSICPNGNVYEQIDNLYRFIDPFDPDLIIVRD